MINAEQPHRVSQWASRRHTWSLGDHGFIRGALRLNTCGRSGRRESSNGRRPLPKLVERFRTRMTLQQCPMVAKVVQPFHSHTHPSLAAGRPA